MARIHTSEGKNAIAIWGNSMRNPTYHSILLSFLFASCLSGLQFTCAGTRIDAFRKEVAQHVSLLHLPGCSVAVMQDNQVLYREEIGFADIDTKRALAPDSIFWIASVTKTFSAAMLMQYAQENRITLDDRVTSYPFASVGFLPARITPNVRLKHVLSHTSEATPGDIFIYHGGRFNFLSGVFNSMRGGGPTSFVDEMNARIIEPLHLTSTTAGFPQGDSPAKARVVTPYRFDEFTRKFVVNDQSRRTNTAYPAAGMLSSMKDLLAYSRALDENKLMHAATYRRMTHPAATRAGNKSPYAWGWFVQEAHGVTMHWAYGLGGADSALLLRIPQHKLTLVVLSNCSFASAPFRLGSGNALNSPFVVSFVKHFVLPEEQQRIVLNYDRPSTLRDPIVNSNSIYRDELCAQTFSRTFIERRFGDSLHSGELVRLLFEVDTERFSRADPSLMNLLADHPEKTMDAATNHFLNAFRSKSSFHPEVEFDAARRLESQGLKSEALAAYRRVADHIGFEEQESTIEACSEAARLLGADGDVSRALEYQWRSIVYAYRAGYDITSKIRTAQNMLHD